MIEQVEPRILRKFEILQRLGKGAYGVVWKAIHRRTGQVVALKKVFDAFQNVTDAQRTYRQVMLLKGLAGNPNIVSLLGVLSAENSKDIYLIFEFMQTDLHVAIRAQILEDVHKRYVIYQLAKALKYIHSAEVIHRDLKPSNLLLNSSCLAKIADFGLARSVVEKPGLQNILTEHIATRWYRAPEILLGSNSYTKAVDMWSVGCIIAEVVFGKALFMGNSTLNQIEKIVELLGAPTQEDIQSLQSPFSSDILSQINSPKKKRIATVFSDLPEDIFDLLCKLLVYNPQKRLTAEQLLSHDYLKDFSDPQNQIVSQNYVQPHKDDNIKCSIRYYRDVLYAMDKSKRSPSKSPIRTPQKPVKKCVVQQHYESSKSRQKPSPIKQQRWHNVSTTVKLSVKHPFNQMAASPQKSYCRFEQGTPDRTLKNYTQSTCSRGSRNDRGLPLTPSKLLKSYSRKVL